MAITVKDIHDKEFKRRGRAYDEVEVDDFLDEVAEEFEALIKENKSLRARIEGLEDQSMQSKQMDNTLRNTLLMAQRVAEETESDARRRAEQVLANAEEQSRSKVAEAQTEAERIRGEVSALKAAAEDYRVRFIRLIEEQARVLRVDVDRLFEE